MQGVQHHIRRNEHRQILFINIHQCLVKAGVTDAFGNGKPVFLQQAQFPFGQPVFDLNGIQVLHGTKKYRIRIELHECSSGRILLCQFCIGFILIGS